MNMDTLSIGIRALSWANMDYYPSQLPQDYLQSSPLPPSFTTAYHYHHLHQQLPPPPQYSSSDSQSTVSGYYSTHFMVRSSKKLMPRATITWKRRKKRLMIPKELVLECLQAEEDDSAQELLPIRRELVGIDDTHKVFDESLERDKVTLPTMNQLGCIIEALDLLYATPSWAARPQPHCNYNIVQVHGTPPKKHHRPQMMNWKKKKMKVLKFSDTLHRFILAELSSSGVYVERTSCGGSKDDILSTQERLLEDTHKLFDEMISSNSASQPILVRSMQPVIATKSMASGQVPSTPPLLGCDGYLNIFTRFSDQVERLNCITEVFDPGILHHMASLSECIDQVMLWFKRVTYCDARTPIRICLRVLTDECMEVGMLQQLHHYTHIALVGHCNSLDFPHNLLCYELLPNGSLETWCSILMSIEPGELPLAIEDNWSSVINLLENVVSDIVLNLLGNNVVGDVLCMGDYEYKGLPDEASYREGANFFSLTRLPMVSKLVGKCESSLREVFVEAVTPELSIMLLHGIEAFMRAAYVSNLKTSWVTHYDLKTSGFTICYAITGGNDTLGGASDEWEKCEPFRGMLIYRCKIVSIVVSLLHLEHVSFELLEIVNHMSYTYPDRVGATGLLQETPTMIKAWFAGQWLHAYVLVMSLFLAVVLVAPYGMCCGDESLRVVFYRQEEDGMIWHIITGSTCGKETTHDLEFVTLINDMLIRPSTVPLASLISLCGAVGALNMIGLVLFVDVLLKTTLVVKFAKHGEIDVIFQLFSEDRYQVVYMWSLLIIWLSIQCCGIQALVNMEARSIQAFLLRLQLLKVKITIPLQQLPSSNSGLLFLYQV